jgi:hypothetical protein
VTVVATDNDGASTSPLVFTLTVTNVNDMPSFTAGPNVTVDEDSAPYSAAWATAISAGPSENTQTVSFTTTNDNNALFAVQPAISPSGVLSFTLAADAFGTATVSATIHDNGGTANGGVDASAAQSFTITVRGVNDDPSFDGNGDVFVMEDSGPYSALWASHVSPGGGNEAGNVTLSITNVTTTNRRCSPSRRPSTTTAL